MSSDNSAAPDVVDDTVMDDAITDASRAVDTFCARQFYASAETLALDLPDPYDRAIWFGRDVLAVQGASNGDGTLLAAANYYLWPRGAQAYAAITLTEAASFGWVAASTGNTQGVISIAASVGYVNRAASAASDPSKGQQVISATHRATLIKAAIMYRQRTQTSVETRVVKDNDWQKLVEGYVRRIY
jgi:hypothetical protein